MPLFRNDDVSFETDVDSFKKFCAIFHQYGFQQLHGITPYGRTHDVIFDGEICKVYPNMEPITDMSPQTIIDLSQGQFIGDNRPLIDFLNAIPDPIALHGPYHYDFTRLSGDEQREAILEGLHVLGLLFPLKPVTSFIAPFNRYNKDTERVCHELGLTLHVDKGEHLEAMMHYGNRCSLKEGVEYRYHHHRFYEESPFCYYDLSLPGLKRFFMETTGIRPVLSRTAYTECIERCDAQKWYGYAYEKFEKLGQCYTPYRWIRDNLDRDKHIVETGCGAGGVLHMLWHEGFVNLYGYDLDPKAIAAGQLICNETPSSIAFAEADCTQPLPKQAFDVILGMNWIYLLDSFGLTDFLQTHLPSLRPGGYLLFDTIDSSFNEHPLNMYYTQDWKKEESERRPSEYNERFSKEQVTQLLEKFGLTPVEAFSINYVIPRKVYVFKK